VFVLVTDAFGVGFLHRNGASLEVPSPSALDGGQWLGNLTLSETWRPLVGGNCESAVYTRVAWSLCYQEQFYLICVLALWLAPQRLTRALGAVTIAVVAFQLMAADAGALHKYRGTFVYYWDVFAIGLAVYWRLSLSEGSPPWARRGIELGLVVIAVLHAISEERLVAMAPSLFGVILIVLYRWDAVAGSRAWLAPLRACGRRSFSIYLIHLPVTMVGNELLVRAGLDAFWARTLVIMPVVTLAAVAVGWAFHHAIERHFLGRPPELRRRAGAGSDRPVSLGGSLAVKPA
jgi:peptidoglycan/LPS O-acetylase OafA/YrhL